MASEPEDPFFNTLISPVGEEVNEQRGLGDTLVDAIGEYEFEESDDLQLKQPKFDS